MNKVTRSVVQGLWIGARLSVMEQLSIQSFLKNGHEYHLYVYDEVKGVPEGTTIKNADEVVSRHEIFRDDEVQVPIGFSDLFRYKLLSQKDGFWADLDIICLRPFDFTSEYVFAGERTKKGSPERKKYGSHWANGCVMKLQPHSDFAKFCYERCLTIGRAPHAWELGPPILTDAVNTFGLRSYVYTDKTFTPISWWNWRDVISQGLSTRLEIELKLLFRPHAVHLWDSMWVREKVDKTFRYDPKCLYERLKEKYLEFPE